MLPYSRIACFSCSLDLQGRGGRSLRDEFSSNTRRYMLCFSIFQFLGSSSYVARIILARKLVDNGTLLDGRDTILLEGWKGLFLL